MKQAFLKSKSHCETVISADLAYEGSISIFAVLAVKQHPFPQTKSFLYLSSFFCCYIL